jgi:DNA-binding NarL/FixJ family response regulator
MPSNAPKPALEIFLVDDSILICQRLSRLLSAIPGVQVVGMAATPEEAIEGIARSRPHVAVIDMQLLGGSGLTVLKRLPVLCPPIVAIVLTNHANAQFRRECLRAGARFFFDKSTEFDRVRDTVRQMVEDHDENTRRTGYDSNSRNNDAS